jgi:hypothetical protein
MPMLQNGSFAYDFHFLINEDRLRGLLAIAKIQVPIKANCMGKGIYA